MEMARSWRWQKSQTRVSDAIKGGEDGTMGFFVAGFVRDESSAMNVSEEDHAAEVSVELEDNEAEWGGFSEDES